MDALRADAGILDSITNGMNSPKQSDKDPKFPRNLEYEK